MGLLSNPNTTQQGEFVKKLINYHKSFCFLLYIVGIVWFCCLALPDLNHGTYFSENALLPGLVYSEINFDNINLVKTWNAELQREREDYRSDIPYSWILAKMKQIGLESYLHNFTLHYPFGNKSVFTGKNIYGILRAARATSTEALVISVPYRNPESINLDVSVGVPLMLAFADFAIKQKYWAKDIIFLITDKEQLGAYAWLEAYHQHNGKGILNSGKLNARAGSIQAAINLEIHDLDIDYIDIKIEGLNGQLPNLDLLNLVQRLSSKENIPTGHKQTSTRRRSGLKSSFTENLKHMLSMVVTQSSGVPTGNHGLFHKYGIEAVTIESFKTTPNRYTSTSINSILRIIEGISRSLNNLLERFHQSYFFYILVASDRFISIGDYMPSIGLMAGTLLIKAFFIWLSITNKLTKPENDNNQEKQEKPINYGYVAVGNVIMLTHCFGFFLLYLPTYSIITNFWINQNIPTPIALSGLYTILSVIIIFIPLLNKIENLSIEILHIFALIETGTCLIAISMMNFSLGFLASLLIVPFAILVKTNQLNDCKEKRNCMKIFSRIFALFLHPLSVTFFTVLLLTIDSFPELTFDLLIKRAISATMDAITFFIVDFMIYGNWLFMVVCVIFLPIWIIFWNLIYPRNQRIIK